MRILLVNPNTSEAITARLLSVAKAAAMPGTEIVGLTAPRGVPYIASRAEAQIGGAITLEMLAEHHDAADAAIIAAFGDPGLPAARELFDIPVVGMAEAAMITACLVGRRFVLVTFSTALGGWFAECVELNGFGDRCCGIRTLTDAVNSVADVQEEKQELLVDLMLRSVAEDNPDAIILAGAPLAGLAEKVAERVPVPVIDQMAAAVMQAETLVRLRLSKARAGAYRRPGPKATVGLPEGLAKRIEHRD
jgi:Asp/Glu/hydantoin racemase